MLNSEGWRKAEHIATVHVDVDIDVDSYKWLEAEAKRTGLDVNHVATTLLRRSCAEKAELNFGPKA